MAKERILELYNDSFEHCLAQEGFLPRFYELFLASSPEVVEKFKHTDLNRQARILKKSLYVLTMATVGTDEALGELERLRQSHGPRGLDIPPRFYDLWLDCLLRAVEEFDPNWNPEVEQSWRRMLTPPIAALQGQPQDA
jgi:hemoglobin-like flavoprotein